MKFGKKEKETQEEEVVRGEIQRVVPDYRVGLNPEQIRIREENGWTNDEVAPPGLTTKEIVHNNIFTYFNLIFLILAVRVALLPGVAKGYLFMLIPRWEYLKDPLVWVWAMGQAFFSLSVTGSGMIVYGAYLGGDEDVVFVSERTALFDTIAAVVAALVIYCHRENIHRLLHGTEHKFRWHVNPINPDESDSK